MADGTYKELRTKMPECILGKSVLSNQSEFSSDNKLRLEQSNMNGKYSFFDHRNSYFDQFQSISASPGFYHSH